jgi:hypothetical protein
LELLARDEEIGVDDPRQFLGWMLFSKKDKHLEIKVEFKHLFFLKMAM